MHNSVVARQVEAKKKEAAAEAVKQEKIHEEKAGVSDKDKVSAETDVQRHKETFTKETAVLKKATKAHKGINPFTKEPIMFKAKPASKNVRARPIKVCKDCVA